MSTIVTFTELMQFLDQPLVKIQLAENLECHEYVTVRDFKETFWTPARIQAILPIPGRGVVTTQNFLDIKLFIQVVAFNEDGFLDYADELEAQYDECGFLG